MLHYSLPLWKNSFEFVTFAGVWLDVTYHQLLSIWDRFHPSFALHLLVWVSNYFISFSPPQLTPTKSIISSSNLRQRANTLSLIQPILLDDSTLIFQIFLQFPWILYWNNSYYQWLNYKIWFYIIHHVFKRLLHWDSFCFGDVKILRKYMSIVLHPL